MNVTASTDGHLQARYIHRKVLHASVDSALVDTLGLMFLIGLIADFIVNFFDFSQPDADPNVTAFVRIICIFYLTIYFANTCLLMSPWKATIGMKLNGLYLTSSSEQRPSLIQTLKFFVFSPVYLPLICLNAYVWFSREPLGLYNTVTAGILYTGGTAILISIYALLFGSVLNARRKLTGLETKITYKHAEKLKKMSSRKELYLKRWLTPLTYKDKGILVIYLGIFLYFPILFVSNYLIPPSSNYSSYIPYEIDWGDDNAFFALSGLSAPKEITNSYEYGRSFAYKEFLMMENIKKEVGIPYLFDIPPAANFHKFTFDQPGIEFHQLKGARGINKYFDCLFDFEEIGPSQECGTPEDLETSKRLNAIIWERFNDIPNYSKFSTPPPTPDEINLTEYLAMTPGHGYLFLNDFTFNKYPLRGEVVIELARLKAADIIQMQRQGKSEEALKEWLKFMKLYRQMTESKASIELKGVYLIIFGIHADILETLLYNDPELAKSFSDNIESALNPQGLQAFNGAAMMGDHYASFELTMMYETGKSTGIQNRINDCINLTANLPNLTAKEFFTVDISNLCPSLQYDDPGDIMKNISLTTQGNPVVNYLWAGMYRSHLIGTEFFGLMHARDAQLRMMVLGTQILSQNIPSDEIDEFVRNAPRELQNPIDESPFHWNAQNSYLWFDPSGKLTERKFRLNLKD